MDIQIVSQCVQLNGRFFLELTPQCQNGPIEPTISNIKMESCDTNEPIQDMSSATMHFCTEVKVEKFDECINEEEAYGENDSNSEFVDPDQQLLPKIIKIDSMPEKNEHVKSFNKLENILADDCATLQSDENLFPKIIEPKHNKKVNTHEINQDSVSEKEMKKKFEDIDEEIKQETLEYEELLSNVFQESNHIRIVPNNIEIEKPRIKIEPIDEEIFENDLIQLDHDAFDEMERPNQVFGSGDESSNGDTDTHFNEILNAEDPNPNHMSGKKPRTYTCTKCGYKNYHKQYREHKVTCTATRRHRQIIKTCTPHMCTKCGIEFESLKMYLLHFKNHQYKFLACPLCKVTFEYMYILKVHVSSHIRQNFVQMHLINESVYETENYKKCYECKQCKERVEQEDFFSHWESHLEIKDVPLEIECNKNDTVEIVADNKEAIQSRLIKHLIEVLLKPDFNIGLKPCIICHRNFKRKNECKRHIIQHLLLDALDKRDACKSKMLQCQICQEELKKSDSYKRHMRDHGNLPIYRCELCEHTFSDSSNFAKHKKTHNLQVMYCDICNKKFLSKPSLIRHIEMHRTTKPISCQYCPKLIFYTKSSYNKHYRNNHLIIMKSFKCTLCVKKFDTSKDKWDHMWEVHGERKYMADCPICYKSFRKYQDVRSHVKHVHNSKDHIFKLKMIKDNVAKRKNQLKTQREVDNLNSSNQQSANSHPISLQSVKSHAPPQLVKLRTNTEQSVKTEEQAQLLSNKEELKVYSQKEQVPKQIAQQSNKEEFRVYSMKGQSAKQIPQAEIKRNPVKDTFAKLFSVKKILAKNPIERSQNQQPANPHLTKDQLENCYTVVKIRKKYSNDLILKQRSTTKVEGGKLVQRHPNKDQLLKANLMGGIKLKMQLEKPHPTEQQNLSPASRQEQFLEACHEACDVTNHPVAKSSRAIKIRPLNSKVKILEKVPRSSINQQLIKSESGHYKLIVLNRNT